MSEQCITYRVCWLDVPTNRLAAELIEAASDEAAIARVEDGGFGSKCEIWHGRRLVAQIEETRLQA